MKMYRIQLQPGLSMPEIFDPYGSKVQCHAALQSARWWSGFVCASCGGAARSHFSRSGSPHAQCRVCPHQTSSMSGAFFDSGKLSLTRWFLAMRLLTQSNNNVSTPELKSQLTVSYRSASLIKHRIVQAPHLAEDRRELGGRIEIDDNYLGGEFSDGKTGRGTHIKVPFIAAVQATPDGRPLYTCFSKKLSTQEAIAAFAARHIAPAAKVVSDELWCFSAITLVGTEHERIVTGGSKASMSLPQFKWVNTLLSNLKTAITGAHHVFDFAKYAHRYLVDFKCRCNHCFNMETILSHLLNCLVAAPPSCERRLRAAEVHR